MTAHKQTDSKNTAPTIKTKALQQKDKPNKPHITELPKSYEEWTAAELNITHNIFGVTTKKIFKNDLRTLTLEMLNNL